MKGGSLRGNIGRTDVLDLRFTLRLLERLCVMFGDSVYDSAALCLLEPGRPKTSTGLAFDDP